MFIVTLILSIILCAMVGAIFQVWHNQGSCVFVPPAKPTILQLQVHPPACDQLLNHAKQITPFFFQSPPFERLCLPWYQPLTKQIVRPVLESVINQVSKHYHVLSVFCQEFYLNKNSSDTDWKTLVYYNHVYVAFVALGETQMTWNDTPYVLSTGSLVVFPNSRWITKPKLEGWHLVLPLTLQPFHLDRLPAKKQYHVFNSKWRKKPRWRSFSWRL